MEEQQIAPPPKPKESKIRVGDDTPSQFVGQDKSSAIPQSQTPADLKDAKTARILNPLNSQNETTKNFSVAYQDLTFVRRLGQGADGEVFEGLLHGFEKVAIKRFLLDDFSAEMRQKIRLEATVMAIDSEYVVGLRGICLQAPHYCLVMQFLPQGDLHQLLENPKRPLKRSERIRLSADIAIGLLILHRHHVIHRDLKSLNVLISWREGELHALVSDFGLATLKRSVLHSEDGVMGSLPWLAPEIVAGTGEYSEASDIYSLGMVIYELATGKVPYYGLPGKPEKPTFEQIKTWILSGERPWQYLPDDCPTELAQLIRDCCAEDPQKRPTAKSVAERLEKLYTTEKDEESLDVLTPTSPAPSHVFPAFSHPELPITDTTEAALLARFTIDPPDEKGTPTDLHDTYDRLYQRMCTYQLSLAAQYQFMQSCYRYWSLQLPHAHDATTASNTTLKLQSKLRLAAKGRLLYREVEERLGKKHARYYWVSKTSSDSPTRTGAFYLCYPSFELPPLQSATAEITAEETIEEPALLQDLADQERAERVLRQKQMICGQIKKVSDTFCSEASLTQQQISHYHIAVLLCEREYVQPITSQGQAHMSATYYFSKVTGAQQLAQWRQQPPIVSDAFDQAVASVRDAMEQAVLRSARSALFHEQMAICHQTLAAHTWDLRAFYRLQHTIFTLHTTYPEADPKEVQPLLITLASFLNEGEYDDPYRQDVNTTLNKICRSAETDWTLPSLTDAVLSTIQQWHQHGRTTLAQAQLRFYRQALQTQLQTLTSKIASLTSEIERGPVQKIIDTLQHSLAACEKTADIIAQLTTTPGIPKLPVSQWSSREQMIKTWHYEAEKNLKEKKLSHEILNLNTEKAKALLQQLCLEIETQLGKPPCPWSVMISGSGARGEISFCSDVDFVLCIGDETAKQHPYFRAVLNLLVYKTSQFPQDVLPLEAKELYAMQQGECWIDTPAHLLAEHCFLPDDERTLGGAFLSDRSYPIRWLSPVYFSQYEHARAEQLWQDYQAGLDDFFHQKTSAGIPHHCLTEPWCLQQHLKPDVLSSLESTPESPKEKKDSPRRKDADLLKETKEVKKQEFKESTGFIYQNNDLLTGTPDFSTEEAKENPEPKKDAEAKEASKTIEQTQTTIPPSVVSLKAVLYPLTHAVLSWGRYTGITHITETRMLLDQIDSAKLIPQTFTKRLRDALSDLHSWRLRQHWTWLQTDDRPTTLQLDEVFLWPENPDQQKLMSTLPRGFYLDERETQQFNHIRITVETVIVQSVPAFLQFAQTNNNSIQTTGSFLLVPSLFKHESTPDKTEEKEEEKRELKSAPLDDELEHLSETDTVAEDKTSIRSKHFDPLASAVEAAQSRIDTLPDKKADTTQLAQQETQQATDVRWLAQIMAICADELPPLELHKSDPTRVKTNPLLRQHWRVYWELPFRWRDLYMRQLQQSASTETHTIIQDLCQSPSRSGWRWCIQEEENAWQQSLETLLEQPPQLGGIPDSMQDDIREGKAVWVQWVAGQHIQSAPLKPEHVAALFDSSGWKPKSKDIISNHHVYCLTDADKPKFWVRRYPEQPGAEKLVTMLDRRLGLLGTPMQQLMAVHHAPVPFKKVKDKQDKEEKSSTIRHSAISLSSHVADAKENLHAVLEKNPSQLKLLDFFSFVRTLLRVLLTNPEDDKGNDYFLLPIPGTDRLQLIRIDNERAFFNATYLSTGFFKTEHLQVKSVLYCMDQMTTPWDTDSDPKLRDFLDDFRQIQPTALIADILKDLNRLHQSWQMLFPEAVVAQHARCQEPWQSLPVLLLPEGIETSLLKRLTAVQTALRLLKPHEITGLKLLEVTQPRLAHYYKNAFRQQPLNPDKPHAQVLARFEIVAGPYYQKSSTGEYQSSLLSGTQLLSRQVSMPLPQVSKTKPETDACAAFALSVWYQQSHSVIQALEQTQHWQPVSVDQVKVNLLAMRIEGRIQFGILSAREQRLLLNQLLHQTLTIKQQAFLLTTLTDVQCQSLNLRAFKTTLTNETLIPIIKESGSQLIALDISGCTHVSEDVLVSLSTHCPNLKRLRCHGVPWKNINLKNFPNLVTFECTEAHELMTMEFHEVPQLRKIDLTRSGVETVWGEAPKLNTLKLDNCLQLCHLGERSRSVKRPLHVPRLWHLHLKGCTRVQSISAIPDDLFFGKVLVCLKEYARLSQLELNCRFRYIDKELILTEINRNNEIIAIPDFLIDSLKNLVTSLDFSSKDKRLSKTQLKSLILYLSIDCIITSLNLKNNELDDEVTESLINGLQSNFSLTSLDSNITKKETKDKIQRYLERNQLIKNFKNKLYITELNISHYYLGDLGAQLLANFIKTTSSLIKLNLSNNQIGIWGTSELAFALKENNSLTQLDLSGNQIDIGISFLSRALQNHVSLTQLNLANNQLGYHVRELCRNLNKTSLTTLDLSNNQIEDDEVEALAKALDVYKTSLTELNLNNNHCRNGFEKLVKALKRNESLKKLSLSNNLISNIDVQEFFRMLDCNYSLTYLDLSNNNITGGLIILAMGLQLHNYHYLGSLSTLILSGNKIGWGLTTFLARTLEDNTFLTTLNLSDNRINDEDARAFAKMIRINNCLINLDLSKNKISDAGAIALAEALEVNTSLTTLDLSDNKLSDVGKTALEKIEERLKCNRQQQAIKNPSIPPLDEKQEKAPTTSHATSDVKQSQPDLTESPISTSRDISLRKGTGEQKTFEPQEKKLLSLTTDVPTKSDNLPDSTSPLDSKKSDEKHNKPKTDSSSSTQTNDKNDSTINPSQVSSSFFSTTTSSTNHSILSYSSSSEASVSSSSSSSSSSSISAPVPSPPGSSSNEN